MVLKGAADASSMPASSHDNLCIAARAAARLLPYGGIVHFLGAHRIQSTIHAFSDPSVGLPVE